MSEDGRPSIATMRRYTWMNVLTAFLVWGIALAGVSMMMPVMYGTISKDMGWTISQTTSFMAIKSAVSGIAGIFAGGLIIKFGLKRVFVQAVIVVGLATLALYFVSSLPIFYGLAAVSGFASILALISVQVTLARWHSASIGRITGVAMLGGAAAGTIVPLITSFGLQNFGWHATAATAGALVLTVVLGAAIFMFRETPEAYGYTADELDPGPAGGKGAQARSQMAADPGPEFRSILKTRQFILLIIAAALSGAISNGVNEYIPLFIERQANMGAYFAALGFTIVLVISGLGKILFGWVFDRFSTKGVAACWALCGIAVLLSFPVAGVVTFLIFMVVRGVSHGGVVVQAPVLARHLYGIKPIAQVIAFLNAAFHIGAATGIWAIGVGVDLSGGFGIPFIAVAIVAGLCALIGLKLEPKYWTGYTAPGTSAHAGR